VRRRRGRHTASTYNEQDKQKIQRQRTRNNLIGILVLAIAIAFAYDLGGIATSVAQFLFRGMP